MIKKNALRNRNDSPGFEISPLLEVGFLLLICCSLLTPAHALRGGGSGPGTPGSLSSRSAPFRVDFDRPAVEVDAAGGLSRLTEAGETKPDSGTQPTCEERFRNGRQAVPLREGEGISAGLRVEDEVPGRRGMDGVHVLAGGDVAKIVPADLEAG